MALTDQQILDELQSAVLNPRDLGVTWVNGLWDTTEVLNRMNERQNRFLKHTQLLIGTANLLVGAGIHRVALPQDWLLTAGVVWRGADGTVKDLPRGDSFEADHGLVTWPTTTADAPDLYFDYDQPVLEIQLAPAPTLAGSLDLLYVAAGAPLDGTGELIGLPDEFAASGVKYGTLADLLNKNGRGRSPDRASYAEIRYTLGMAVADLLLHSWVESA